MNNSQTDLFQQAKTCFTLYAQAPQLGYVDEHNNSGLHGYSLNIQRSYST